MNSVECSSRLLMLQFHPWALDRSYLKFLTRHGGSLPHLKSIHICVFNSSVSTGVPTAAARSVADFMLAGRVPDLQALEPWYVYVCGTTIFALYLML